MSGPNEWTQPLFGADAVPHLVVSGVDIDLEFSSYSAEPVDPAGVAVRNLAGQSIPHVLLAEEAAPLSLTPFEIEIELQQVSEDVRRQLGTSQARATRGDLFVWMDRVGYDVWEGDGSQTTFVLSRSTGYATSGVSWALRPARCWVAEVEQTMVTGSPSSGECQLSQVADSTSIVLGAAPAASAVVVLAYYPLLWIETVEGPNEDKGGYNDAAISITFREGIQERVYA